MATPASEHRVPLALKIGLGLIFLAIVCSAAIALYGAIFHIPININLILSVAGGCTMVGLFTVVLSHSKPSTLVSEFFNDLSKMGLKKPTSQPPAPTTTPPTTTHIPSLPRPYTARATPNIKAPETSH